jgi:hypothetical protein
MKRFSITKRMKLRNQFARTNQKILELGDAFSDIKKAADEAAQSFNKFPKSICPNPHPQADFEFICDLCGMYVPARLPLSAVERLSA